MITNREAEEILKKEYHIDNFLYVVNELLLPDFEEDRHEVEFNNDLFASVTELGQSDKCDVTVYEVILKEHTQNRRVAITQQMFKILRGQAVNNAVVAFANADRRNYRFSLLTSKYELDGDKVVKVLSNPRRYSYSLGYGTKTKTAYDFLIGKGKVNSLDELINRFSVEVVNKQFYNEIALAFTKLVGGQRDGKSYEKELNLYGVTDPNKYAEFAVRLIGRIVFCWFLKEKKSEAGIPLIPENMITAQGVAGGNYYHDVLEPLFFELLNTNQNRRKGKFAQEEAYTQIPYLNGGLFSPHADDHYKFSHELQSGEYGLVTIPNEWFLNFYNILGQYNFTVDENTSYDIELSIDPEMLGRIFENLLAEINPETGENAKKSTGSFYTPREIVDYMVDNSILEHLKSKTGIDETKLKALISYGKEDDELATFTQLEKKAIINSLYTVTVLDPACGSGAFPIGMLQKIVYMLQEIDPEANLWFDKATEHISFLMRKEFEKKFNAGSLDYIRKLTVIQNSIFGIDIQPIAVEIARLRCFLSLVIEEKVYDDEPNRGINPLPNLDFKFIIANTLVSLPHESDYKKDVQSTQMSLFEREDHITRLRNVREQYFSANNAETKAELKFEFTEIQNAMFQEALDNRKMASARYQALFQWKPFNNEATGWFDAEWMFGVKNGFDIVIGNPPYLDSENMVNSGLSQLREYISHKYRFCRGNWDIYIAFIEFGVISTNSNGIVTYITPDKWISKPFGDKLRIGIINNISSILFAGRDVFESALVDSIITLVSKQPTENIGIYEMSKKENTVEFIRSVSKKLLTEPFKLDIVKSDAIGFVSTLDLNYDKLGKHFICENACATSDCYKLKEILYSLDTPEDYDLDMHYKLINTGTIDKYSALWGCKPIKYLKDKYNFPVVNKEDFHGMFINSYGIKATKAKLIIKGLTLLDACIDYQGEVIPGKSTIIVTSDNHDNLNYACALINSKLAFYYISQKYSSASYNGGITFTKDMIADIPYAEPSVNLRNEIIELVQYLVDNPHITDESKTAVQEEMDNRIFELYGISDDDKLVIEDFCSK